ncbi:hypothetical protein HDU83_004245 [Entophlyctis luteolus]|nr:hypothetical protein HDU82_007623 [Entophlyctis luteolus]KAJ3345291.1 hypothetical protein HDU83_004245 [Entophlyctis luteolus]KAJ3382360.1 hypothetical protein HDU84_004357 [Entophlyctis sp. JEL0112]
MPVALEQPQSKSMLSSATAAPKALLDAGISAAKDVAQILDPYLPLSAKQVAEYAMEQTTSLTDYTGKATARAVNGFDSLKNDTFAAAEGVRAQVSKKYEDTVSLASRAVVATSDVVLAYTPPTAVKLVNQALSGVDAVRVDGLQGLKDYVPAFVVKGSTQTFEIFENVAHKLEVTTQTTKDTIMSNVNATKTTIVNNVQSAKSSVFNNVQSTVQTAKTAVSGKCSATVAAVDASRRSVTDLIMSKFNASTGFIVAKVDGTVKYVIAIPHVKVLLNKIDALAGKNTTIGRTLDYFGVTAVAAYVLGSILPKSASARPEEETQSDENAKDLDSGVVLPNGNGHHDAEATDSDTNSDEGRGLEMKQSSGSVVSGQ